MGKLRVEICIVSARGLRRSSSLWRLQWFAVGWVDPNCKYCTRIDASGNANPVWRTKFAALVDGSEDLALNVEVYSREPIFLREKLQGTATVCLREFLSERNKRVSRTREEEEEEVGSYQLRRRGSDKPQGFVDVSIRISEGNEGNGEPYSMLGNEREDLNNGESITLAKGDGPTKTFPTEIPLASFHRKPELSIHTNPMPHPRNYPMASGPSYVPSRAPLQPPERLADNNYINMPSSSSSSSVGPAPTRGVGPSLVMGLGAGALAAGAVIFGDDFMSGFGDPTIVASTNPPF